MVAHPDDERYQPLFGQKRATTPLFGVEVPIVAHRLADPEKGTGIAMVCTFGDTTDVTWWRELSLPIRAVVQRDGRLRPDAWGARLRVDRPGRRADGLRRARRQDRQAGAEAHRRAARRRAAHRGRAPPDHPPGEVLGQRLPSPRDRHASQWFIRYPPKDEMLARGKELQWWPDFMRVRYEDWVNGLIGDWNITRQRFFGVPFPVWYPIDADGVTDFLVADPRRRGRRCPSTPPPPSRPATTSPSATSPVASPPTPTSWTPGPRRRSAPDRLRLGGRPRPLRAHLPDGPAPAGPRDHPHVAVLHRRPQPLRARRAAVAPTPPSPASSSTPTARSSPSRRPTPRRPASPSSSATAPTPSATGRPRAARAWTWRSTRTR